MDPSQPTQPIPPPQHPLLTEPKHHGPKMVLFIILSIFILTVVAGSAYFLGQSSKPTQNNALAPTTAAPLSMPTTEPKIEWKTYTNAEHEFTLQYPGDLYISEKKDLALNHFEVIFSNVPPTAMKSFYDPDKTDNFFISLAVIGKTNNPQREANCCSYTWVQSVLNSFQNAPDGTVKNSLTKIQDLSKRGAEKGIVFELTKEHINETMSIPTLFAAFMKDGKAYLLTGITNNSDLIFPSKYNSLFSQIQNNLTFTDKELISDPSTWNTYINTTHSYSIKYPPDYPPTNDSEQKSDIKTTKSVIFGCGDGEGVCLPSVYISIMPYPITEDLDFYEKLSQKTIDKIFSLKVGSEVDKETTYDIGGSWGQKINYKRLPDAVINGETFLVIDNPDGYGGSDRRWLLKKNNQVVEFGCRYGNAPKLTMCQAIYSTFKFTQ